MNVIMSFTICGGVGMVDKETALERVQIPKALLHEVRQEAFRQVAKYAVGAVILLIVLAGSGWWFYFKSVIPNIVGAVPVNAVIAIDNPSGCASLGSDWEDFADAYGRTIVGAGNGPNLESRRFRDWIGRERYVLVPANLPPHSHEVYKHAGPIIGNTGVRGAGADDPNVGSEVKASFTGDGPGISQPYEVMPPAIVLYYCKKIR
jgi:hypothetical protein